MWHTYTPFTIEENKAYTTRMKRFSVSLIFIHIIITEKGWKCLQILPTLIGVLNYPLLLRFVCRQIFLFIQVNYWLGSI